jgi:hypothetical protein
MKALRISMFVPAALIIGLVITQINIVSAQVVRITNKIQPDPLVVNGQSGGTNKSNCGNIGTQPNQVIEVPESLPYVRLSLESGGQPTLLIDGPSGRFCVLPDNHSGTKPELSGFLAAGTYSVYVGDLSNQQNPYTLSISQQKK